MEMQMQWLEQNSLLVGAAVLAALVLVPKSVWQPALSRLLGQAPPGPSVPGTGTGKDGGATVDAPRLLKLVDLIDHARESGDEELASALEALMVAVHRLEARRE